MRRLSVLLACVVMALTLIAITVATGASAAPKQKGNLPPNHFYGAIDYSKAKNVSYWGHGATKAAANRAAYNNCHKMHGANDCRTQIWVYNGWIALVEGKTGFGFEWGRTEKVAKNKALQLCRAQDTGCKVTALWHTRFDPNKKTKGGYSLPGP